MRVTSPLSIKSNTTYGKDKEGSYDVRKIVKLQNLKISLITQSLYVENTTITILLYL